MGGFAWERVVSDIGLEVRDILALHLGGDGAHLSDETRLHEDLGVRVKGRLSSRCTLKAPRGRNLSFWAFVEYPRVLGVPL